ncbi:MAG: tetratricopeptide repeat protein [Deltaproteobacteria bacterium]|nr:tetratricopeptide repeat protein [Deltaproteobacteria bacterium]
MSFTISIVRNKIRLKLVGRDFDGRRCAAEPEADFKHGPPRRFSGGARALQSRLLQRSPQEIRPARRPQSLQPQCPLQSGPLLLWPGPFNLGILALYTGQSQGAVLELEAAVEVNPGQFGAFLYLGMAYNNLGRFDKALEAFNRVEELSPEYLPVKTKRAVVFYNQARYKQARDNLKRLVAQNPHWADMHYRLGLVYVALGQHQAGIEELEKALAVNPAYLKARISLGLLLGYTGRHQDSVEVLETILKERPDFADVHYHLGQVQASLGRLDQAQASLERALELNPGYFQALFGLGTVLGAQGKLDQARQKLGQVLALEPGHFEAELILKHLKRLEDSRQPRAYREVVGKFWKQAGQDLVRRMEIIPDLSDIVSVFSPTQDRALYQALIAINQATVEKNPGFADVYENLGALYAKLDIHDKAVDGFRQSLAINPDYIRARVNLYKTHMVLGMDHQALQEIEILLERGLDFPDFKLDQGRLFHKLGRDDEAVQCLALTVERNPDLVPAHRLWARIEKKRGRPQEAARILEGYLARTKAHPAPDLLRKFKELRR